MSPTMWAVPAMEPFFAFREGGTTSATGSPNLVTTRPFILSADKTSFTVSCRAKPRFDDRLARSTRGPLSWDPATGLPSLKVESKSRGRAPWRLNGRT